MFKPFNIYKYLLLGITISLTGCGGGGNGSKNENGGDKEVNKLPSVSANIVSANENMQVSLAATATDPDGTIVSYNWSLTSGQALNITGSTSKVITFITPSIAVDIEELTFELTVTDNDGATANTSTTVTVRNIVPTASIAEKTVNEKENVSVMANVNGNGDEIASYLWTQSSGTTVELINADSETVSFIAPEISADEVVGLTLVVTDIDNDMISVNSAVNVNQLTFPLTISGRATDSPISNGQMSVNVAGRDITIDVTADENGYYTVDLLLDDSEATSFISIVAKGVAEQENAGLITLLGTAGQLSAKAGEDNILTEDENFSVNVTNITTAQYALVKLANNDEDISSDAKLQSLIKSLDYKEVLILATAIKVAIDKSGANPDLKLPEGVTNTLDLVNNTKTAQSYVKKVIYEAEFKEAQEEIFEDGNLIDISSVWNVPQTYYLLAPADFYGGKTLHFNDNGTGAQGDFSFAWEQTDGEITANVSDNFEYFIVDRFFNGQVRQIRAQEIYQKFSLKRLSSGEGTDVVLFKRTYVIHFPDGEFPNELKESSSTHSAVKNNGVIDIAHKGAGVAYLPFYDDNPYDPNIITLRVRADEFNLNTNGTGHTTVGGKDFTWKVEDGTIKLDIPSDDENKTVLTWKQLSKDSDRNQFAHERFENDEINTVDDHISQGAIVANPIAWQANEVPGIYVNDYLTFPNDFYSFWFELHENGEAETNYTDDWNNDGQITEDEKSVQYGHWSVNADGTLVITRVRHKLGYSTEECRYETTEDCVLYHERTWRLINQNGNAYSLFHKHDFKYSSFDWGPDELHYGTRTVYKVDVSPIMAKKTVNSKANIKARQKIVYKDKKVLRPKKLNNFEPG